MPETKAATVLEVKRLEATLAEVRETTKNGLLASIQGHIDELRDIGFEYELKAVEGQKTPKNGHSTKCSQCGGTGHTKRTCPQKGGNNGLVQQAKA
ncbi:MAG TPA: hypothetical protein VFA15_01155 [Nitrososphaera sp.]|nr:hypothetical protein [Nitrososphaera sp.]